MNQFRVLVWNNEKMIINEKISYNFEKALLFYNQYLYEKSNWGYLALIKTDSMFWELYGFDLIYSAKNKGGCNVA